MKLPTKYRMDWQGNRLGVKSVQFELHEFISAVGLKIERLSRHKFDTCKKAVREKSNYYGHENHL